MEIRQTKIEGADNKVRVIERILVCSARRLIEETYTLGIFVNSIYVRASRYDKLIVVIRKSFEIQPNLKLTSSRFCS